MMNKKYLMNGFAALALIASVSSCTKDVTTMSQSEIDSKAKENAELQLGFTIPDGQNWVMASQVTANVAVNGDYGANYTVTIYENNPFTSDNTGVVLGSTEVKSGDVATFDFTCPNEAEMVFAAIKDEKGYTYVKPVAVKDGKVEAVFGDEAAGSRAMRAASATNSHVDIPTGASKSTIEAQCAAILAKSVELNSNNNGYNGNNFHSVNAEYQQDASTDWQQVLKGYYVNYNPDYVVNYKISTEYSGLVTHLPTAGYEATGEYTNEADPNGKISANWTGYRPVYNLTARTVYVASGGKWTIPTGSTQVCGQAAKADFVDGIIIVGSNAELEVNGTLNFANLGRLIVLPGGKVTGTGSIQVNNGSKVGEESYNYGTISVATFNENFGNFFNYGTMTCTELQGGAGTSCYVNHGKVHVDHVYPNGQLCANLQIKNNCWWEVDNWNYCKIFQNGSGAYANVGSLFIGGGEGGENAGSVLALDTDSKFVVEDESCFNGTLIYGPSSGNSAYLELGTMTFLNVGMVYPINGNLNVYVAGYGGQNASGYESRWNDNMAGGDGKPQVVGKAAFNTASTDASDCAPAFTPNIPEVVYETLKVYTYAFEDQTVNTDYDMNDVVLKVNYHVTEQGTGANAGKVIYDKTKLDVKLVAAGATFNIKVKIGNTYLFGGKEIHDALNVDPGVMVNTGSGSQTANPAVENGISIPAGWNNDFTKLPVSIEVLSTSTTYVFPNTDLYPHAVMVPTDWAWPQERVNVQLAYPGTSSATKVTIGNVEVPNNSFRAWGGTPAASRTSAMNGWYNNPASGKVMSNN